MSQDESQQDSTNKERFRYNLKNLWDSFDQVDLRYGMQLDINSDEGIFDEELILYQSYPDEDSILNFNIIIGYHKNGDIIKSKFSFYKDIGALQNSDILIIFKDWKICGFVDRQLQDCNKFRFINTRYVSRYKTSLSTITNYKLFRHEYKVHKEPFES